LRFIALSPKRIDETEKDLIEIARFWVEEFGFDGVIFDRCFCGTDCGKFGAYYLKCGHSDCEGHFIKIYNDYCPKCRPRYLG